VERRGKARAFMRRSADFRVSSRLPAACWLCAVRLCLLLIRCCCGCFCFAESVKQRARVSAPYRPPILLVRAQTITTKSNTEYHQISDAIYTRTHVDHIIDTPRQFSITARCRATYEVLIVSDLCFPNQEAEWEPEWCPLELEFFDRRLLLVALLLGRQKDSTRREAAKAIRVSTPTWISYSFATDPSQRTIGGTCPSPQPQPEWTHTQLGPDPNPKFDRSMQPQIAVSPDPSFAQSKYLTK
jgi:hypothetical protein